MSEEKHENRFPPYLLIFYIFILIWAALSWIPFFGY